MQTFGVYHVRQLVELGNHTAKHLRVVDFDIHINGRQLLFGVAAAGNAQHVDLFVGENSGDIAQQAAAVVRHHTYDQRITTGVAFAPYGIHYALRRIQSQIFQLITVGPVNRDPTALRDIPDNLVAWYRLTAARNVMHQIAYAFDHHAAIVFPAVTLRCRCGLLRQLAQRFFVQLLCTRFFQLRLQEVDHLIKADIAIANRSQNFVQRIHVVARQQQFLSILEADFQLVQLVVEDLLTGKDVFVAILFTEPVVDLRTPATGGDIAEVRVQPVTAWVRMLLGDDFNLIAHTQLIGERHNAPTDFGPDTAMSDIAVNVVGEVERRRAHRQVDHIAFRGKHVNTIVEDLTAHFVKHFARIGHLFLPGNQLTQPGNTAFVTTTATTGDRRALFIFPVSSDAQFGVFMHLTGTDLHFQRFTAWSEYHGVNRLITVRFRVSDVVVEFIRQMAEMGMHNPQCGVAVL